MITIKTTANDYQIRANGWVQDSSDFYHLWWFCCAFDKSSPNFAEILNRVNTYVSPESTKQSLKSVMLSSKQKYHYGQIVGHHKGGSSRKTTTVCNGIGQAAVEGQKRPFIGDWPADNFLRWALLLGFVRYIMESDEYQITELGQKFTREKDENKRNKILEEALLAYPPVRRIVRLLKSHPEGMTKFEIGEKLGCVGEKGFTNIGQSLFDSMYQISDNETRKSLLSDKEGSSDKYARQICSWLQTLKLVAVRKPAQSDKAPLNIYFLTPFGIDFARKIDISTNINVQFSMLSMATKNREFIMKRRAMILYFVQEKRITNLESISSKMADYSISTNKEELLDDIASMERCGINISVSSSLIALKDTINNLDIPSRVVLGEEDLADEIKKYLRPRLKHVNHDFLKIIDFSLSGKSGATWFENYTYQVYKLFCPNTKWLGGANKPDVIAEFGNLGLIIDSKAYGEGFSANRSLKDEMARYVNEADQKPDNISIKWWKDFSDSVTHYAFQYVSSSFSNEINNQLEDISAHCYSKEKGSAITAEGLLLLAERALTSGFDPAIFETNKQIVIKE